MKRFLTILAATLLLTAALCVTASASDYDAAAQDLSAIGMFRGTAGGFELDRAPTRSEAAIMLVRLYGAEATAKTAYDAGEIQHPFSDVSAFSSPYVAWLYTNGITNGVTADTFGSARACSVQNYAVFLLRALGYQDGEDFQYADALTFAQEKGFYSPETFAGTFLRDDLAALTYQALAADIKDGETYLLESLVKSGAIDAKAAAPMTEKIEAYRAIQRAVAGMDAGEAVDMDIDLRMDMTLASGGESMVLPVRMSGNVKTILDGKDLQAAYDMDTSMMGMNVAQQMWMKDGWVYISMESGGETMRYKYRAEDESAEMEEMEVVDLESMDVSELAMIDAISVKKSGGSTVYTVTIDSRLGGQMAAVQDALDEASTELEGQEMNMELGDIQVVYTVGGDGTVKDMAMRFSALLKMETEVEGEVLMMDAAYDYDMAVSINATGKAVKITFPSFSGYQEIDPAQLADA